MSSPPSPSSVHNGGSPSTSSSPSTTMCKSRPTAPTWLPSSSSNKSAAASKTRNINMLSPLIIPPRTLSSPSIRPTPHLHLTIRFSLALPDLNLDIVTPHTTTIAALRQPIRDHLASCATKSHTSLGPSSTPATTTAPPPRPPDNPVLAVSRARIRLIHAGKILPDASPLSSVLSIFSPLPPPLAGATSGARPSSFPKPGSGLGKGKAVEGREFRRGGHVTTDEARVYLHCSVGDVALTERELQAEKDLARRTVVNAIQAQLAGVYGDRSASGADLFGGHNPGRDGGASGVGLGIAVPSLGRPGGPPRTLGTALSPSVPHLPRGFDRLVQAGLTPAEVNQLRLSFRSIQAARHTPDTMPSPDTLLAMEDAWMDNNNDLGMGGSRGVLDDDYGGGDGAGQDDDSGMLRALFDTATKGMAIGFFFPLGAFVWLIREEGMWSRRYRGTVVVGLLLSVLFGMVRQLGGDAR